MSPTLNKTKQAWNNTHQSFFFFFFFLHFEFFFFLLVFLPTPPPLPSHAIVHANSTPNKSFYFYCGLSHVANYNSILNDVSPPDNERDASLARNEPVRLARIFRPREMPSSE